MRNLTLLVERHRSVGLKAPLTHKTEVCDLCHVPNFDGSEDSIVLLTVGGVLLCVNSEGEVKWTVNLQDTSTEKGDWFDATYVDPEIVCLSKSGAIVTVSSTTGICELVGEFDHGLEAGKWSPDREILFLITTVDSDAGDLNTVLLSMNAQLEVLAESPIERHEAPGEAGDGAVDIAWRPDGTLCAVSSVDKSDSTRRIRIYSRDDLALSSIGRSEDGSGKVVPNLRAHIAWAGGGCSNLVTAVQRKGKRTLQVVFFEPNGLRHREFPLRPEVDAGSTQPTVLGLHWNVESDLLAVALREPRHDKVQLWHRSNYHWYLKQELRYTTEQIECVRFDEEKAYVLYIATSSEIWTDAGAVQWKEYEFCWDASTVYVPVTEASRCTAFSIDGSSLNMTPFDQVLVPPPMYAATLTMPSPIREICFPPWDNTGLLALAYLSNGTFVLLENEAASITGTKSVATLCLVRWTETLGVPVCSLRQLCIIRSSKRMTHVIAVAPALVNERHDRLVEIEVQQTRDGEATAMITRLTSLERNVLRLINWSDRAEGALVQLDDGMLLEYELTVSEDANILPCRTEPLLEPCPWICALYAGGLSGAEDDGQRLVVGRSSRGRLYHHDRLLADSSSSFVLSPTHHFLCYVTTDTRCQCRFLPLQELYNFDPLLGSDENPRLEGYEPRNVERGARLVAVLPTNPTAILQMPRGNMEGIYPRALVLPYVMNEIQKGAYKEAFRIMRRQKVDLNLIVDMNPLRFLEDGGVEQFVEQVTIIDHMNLFISCLQNTDVTKTRYRVPSWLGRRQENDGNVPSEFDSSKKVNAVCWKIREVLLRIEETGQTKSGLPVPECHFLLPVLSTFAKENPPRLEDALSMIKENAVAIHPMSSKKPPLFGERAQSSLHYLAFLADYKLLFDTALGMYDFELARAVARNSQMDPKVYLPLLKRLKALPAQYAKYEVDMRLKRYEAALTNLVKSCSQEVLDSDGESDDVISYGNDFDDCLSLIKRQKMHVLGLKLFVGEAEKYRAILVSFGEQLLKENEGETALVIFLSAKPPDYEGAKKAARASGDWRYYFSALASETSEDFSVDQTRRVAYTIAEEMIAEQGSKADRRRSHSAAARILLDYCQDADGAVDMLVKAALWTEARRIASIHTRQDLVKKCTESATAYALTLVEGLEARTDSFLEASRRYDAVLAIRKTAIRGSDQHYGEAFDVIADDSGSLFSVASATSNASIRSNLSGSSVGSATSVSSVITVGTQSSFTITGQEGVNKHKYNKMAKQKKKRKPKRQRNKTRPGSEEELRNLVSSLKCNCVDDEFCKLVGDTVMYLVLVGRLQVAGTLFDRYTATKLAIDEAQEQRQAEVTKEKLAAEQRSRLEGAGEAYFDHPVEIEVSGLRCPELMPSIRRLFAVLRAG